MIKTILWDFYGVILNSMKIKGDGFKELFAKYDAKFVMQLEQYHYENGGVSRFEKIRYFFNNILDESISEEKVLKFADKFAIIIEKKLFDKHNLISETVEFIKDNYLKYDFHIVSGAEHNELNTLCRFFDLTEYFRTIEGSPTKKEILIRNIIKKYGYKKDETVLIGDAITDYNASMKNNIKFYGYNNQELKKYNYIESFQEFEI